MIDLNNLSSDAVVKSFVAEDASLPMIMEFIESELEKDFAPMKVSLLIETAVEEMFVNISHYSYKEGKGEATFIVRHYDDKIEVSLVDSGVPFNPLAKEDPDVSLSAEEREIGGLGIYMVKKSMDEVYYQRQNDKNVFTMVKKVK